MKRLSIKQVLAGSMAFFVLSTSVVVAGLWAGSLFEWFDVELKHYVGFPLLAWVLAGTYICLTLIGRLLRNIDGRPQPIKTIAANPAAGRAIPWTRNNTTSNVFASVQRWAVGNLEERSSNFSEPESQPIIAWVVPVDDGQRIRIREHEIKAFLQAAAARRKHQLSRRHWVQKKRLWICRYQAYIRLLVESDLVEGRQHGSSGRLVTDARHCLRILTHQSSYRLS